MKLLIEFEKNKQFYGYFFWNIEPLLASAAERLRDGRLKFRAEVRKQDHVAN